MAGSPNRTGGCVSFVLFLAVIGILAAIAVPQLLGAREKARTATADNIYVALNSEVANELDDAMNGGGYHGAPMLDPAYARRQHASAAAGDQRMTALRKALPPSGVVVRKIVHDGIALLRVDSVPSGLSRVRRIALRAGGHVDQLEAHRIVIRIPTGRFHATFGEILELGEVVRKSIRAQDVTRRSRDLDLRLEASRATRSRLLALLKRARETEEKVRLLSEVQRISERIEALEIERAALASRVAFARIAVELEAEASAAAPRTADLDAFAWIAALSPFRDAVARTGERLDLEPPSGMVLLSATGPWIAEAADGAVVRSSSFRNRPRGDARFWAEAIRRRLVPELGEATIEDRGGFRVIRFGPPPGERYRYLVSVRTDEDELQIVEAYYPGPEAEERHGEAVLESLDAGPREEGRS